MAEAALNVMAVVGSLSKASITRTVLLHVGNNLQTAGCRLDLLDFQAEPLALFDPETVYVAPHYGNLQKRVERADVFLLGTPDYHGSISSTLKNFLDHFWREFTGKLFVPMVASHEKGLTVIDQVRTVARQCYAWTLPYGVSYIENQDVKEGEIVSDALKLRLEMLARDVRVYGAILAAQRLRDLQGHEPGFMARLR